MTTLLRPERWLQRAAGETEVIVVRPPFEPAALECSGAPMVALGVEHVRPSIDPMHAEGTMTGEQCAHALLGLELPCTKGGHGSLSIGGIPLPSKDAKPLPSSDS